MRELAGIGTGSDGSAAAGLAVIGAGPGGYAAAYRAADLGCAVTLIDTAPNPGGVCAYHGCIPSKALLHAVRVLNDAKHAASMGLAFGPPRVDLDALRSWKNAVVERLTAGNGQLAMARKVTYVRGKAAIVDPHHVRVTVERGETIEIGFDHLILATGSRPSTLPGVSPGGRIWDSSLALDLPFIPTKLLVVGGCDIGLELGTIYAALGSAVTIVEGSAKLLPGVDSDLVEMLSRRLTGVFAAIQLGQRVRRLEETSRGVRAVIEAASGQTTEAVFDAALIAVGRRPNSEIEGLERTAVRVDSRHFIEVDRQRRTAEPSIFAIGDLVGEPMLAHKAVHEGLAAAEVIAGARVRFDARAIPGVVFTDPEVAWCGLTELQAAARSRAVTIARFPWGASGRAATLGAPPGLTKLVIDPVTERILGAGIVGAGAGELIAEAVLAVEMGAVAKEMATTVHPHPTLSETLMEAAEVFNGLATHVYRPRPQVGPRRAVS